MLASMPYTAALKFIEHGGRFQTDRSLPVIMTDEDCSQYRPSGEPAVTVVTRAVTDEP